MGKVIAMASGKGGTGKSSLAVFVGRALALRGKTVLLVEATPGLRGLDLMLGLEDSAIYDCGDLLEDRCKASEAVMPTGVLGMWLLPAANRADLLPDRGRWARLMDLYRSCYDFVLVDLPAGLGPMVQLGCLCADQVLAVAVPTPAAVRGCGQLGRMLSGMGQHSLKLVINMVPDRLAGPVEDLDAVMDSIGLELLGVVPQQLQVAEAAAWGRAIPAGCLARTACENIAARLCGLYRPLCVE